jgi:hypothetical protein
MAEVPKALPWAAIRLPLWGVKDNTATQLKSPMDHRGSWSKLASFFGRSALALGLSLIAAQKAQALGADHPSDKPLTAQTNWPSGLEHLVNTTNRIHGFFVNSEDFYFYAGSEARFAGFLKDYAQLGGTDPKRLIIHEGVGEAKSPWAKEGRPCDWKLYTCPKGWHSLGRLAMDKSSTPEQRRKAAQEPGYVLELHVWKGGTIALDRIEIPKNIVVVHD